MSTTEGALEAVGEHAVTGGAAVAAAFGGNPELFEAFAEGATEAWDPTEFEGGLVDAQRLKYEAGGDPWVPVHEVSNQPGLQPVEQEAIAAYALEELALNDAAEPERSPGRGGRGPQ